MKKGKSNKSVIITLLSMTLIVLGLITYLKIFKVEEYSTTEIPSQEISTIEDVVIPEASIPKSLPPENSEPDISNKVFSLPPLDDSDEFLRKRISLLSKNQDLSVWITTDDLLRRIVSYTDGLSRGVALDKIFPLSPPDGKFTTHIDGENIWLNAGNYERYDRTISAIVSLDPKMLAKIFHFSRPLLETAFAELGYNIRQMDGIILTALDQLIATPVIYEPIMLTRESVTYKFADSNLERLKPIQKQLIRSGPTNTERIKNQAAAIKKYLLNPNEI